MTRPRPEVGQWDCASGCNLLAHHRTLIERSAPGEVVAIERGYRSVPAAAELEQLGFAGPQQRTPALLIPIWDVHGASSDPPGAARRSAHGQEREAVQVRDAAWRPDAPGRASAFARDAR